MTVTALIVAAGKGERLGGDVPKQFRELGGIPVLRRAVIPFADHPRIDNVLVVVAEDAQEQALKAIGGGFRTDLVIGGVTRAQSVRNGLAAVKTEKVLVHDAARPFCPADVIDRLVDALDDYPAAVPVLPINDTLARWTEVLGETIVRDDAVRVQTPQAFSLKALRDAYEKWSGREPTDESTVARAAGLEVRGVAGALELEKLTTADDWRRAEERVARRTVSRTGMGFDVHAFAGEGPVMLGGVAVPHSRGLAGHSDADVVLHSITDALLGAAALGDIGEHFPPSDPQWKGMSSDLFLVHAAALIRQRGGTIDHIDVTIIAEEPKVGPHRSAIRSRIAEILRLGEDQVSIKATTTEGMGFTGRHEGIAAQAIASIRMAGSA